MTVAAIIAAVALNAAPVTAPEATTEVAFRFDAALLQTEAGAQRLHSKMVRRARAACRGTTVQSRSYAVQTTCREEVVDQWVAAIDHPRLNAAHEGEARPAFAAR